MSSDLLDRRDECLWRFLRKIVPDATGDEAVRIPPRELCCICARIEVWRAIRVPFERYGRHRDDRSRGESTLEIIVP